MQRGTYRLIKMQALDKNFNQIWYWESTQEDKKYSGQSGHGLLTADVDKDGKDELVMGAAVIDDNGKGLWTLGMGHPDVAYVADIDPDNPGLVVSRAPSSSIRPARPEKSPQFCNSRGEDAYNFGSVAVGDVPGRVRRGTQDQHSGAVTTFELWFALQRDPAPAARALAGTAYAGAHRYPKAVEQLSLAIEQANQPQENWYRQLLAVHYQSRRYTAAAELLQRMILLFPERKDYWLQLSGVYAETGNQTQSVAVLELAYLQGVLTEERDLLNLAQHYLYTGLAHKAGQLLERSLRDGTVTATRENWALLVDAWLHARETDRALGAVERALESVAHADLHLRHAQLLADKEDWSEVVRATELALAGDALTRRGTAHLLAGVAHFHLQHPREARSCFERAREFDRSRHQAEQWLQHLATSQLYAGSHSPQRLSP